MQSTWRARRNTYQGVPHVRSQGGTPSEKVETFHGERREGRVDDAHGVEVEVCSWVVRLLVE